MALSTTFGPLTAATGAELDVNFAEVGALATVQLILSGRTKHTQGVDHVRH